MPSCTVCATSANLPSSLGAKRRARCSWPAASTLTPKRPARRTSGSVRAPLSKHTSTSTGSSESEATALAVIPWGPPGASTVTTATPVAKWPMTVRKRWGSTVFIAPPGCRTCRAPRTLGGPRRPARGGPGGGFAGSWKAAIVPYALPPHAPPPDAPGPDPARRGRRRLRLGEHQARLEQPGLRGREDLRPALRRLPHPRHGRHTGLGRRRQQARVQGRPELQPAQGGLPGDPLR